MVIAKPGTQFDQYARDYQAGMENPIKALLGESADAYVAVKLRWLVHRYPELHAADRSYNVLDYGCGTATLLRLMAEAGIGAKLVGSDVSAGMLDEAARCWPHGLERPSFHLQDAARTQFPSASSDLILISAVLHHVPPAERSDVYAELYRLARPGGRLVVFEHNPINPVTRYVVAHTPIDHDAVLLRSSEVATGVRRAGFTNLCTSYLMFLPPRLEALAWMERALEWLPLGGQYAVTAIKPPV